MTCPPVSWLISHPVPITYKTAGKNEIFVICLPLGDQKINLHLADCSRWMISGVILNIGKAALKHPSLKLQLQLTCDKPTFLVLVSHGKEMKSRILNWSCRTPSMHVIAGMCCYIPIVTTIKSNHILTFPHSKNKNSGPIFLYVLTC